MVVMGFTGKKATEFKEAYIEVFNKMEAALRCPVQEAGEFLSANDERNLRRCIWQIANNMRYEQAWIQGTWHSLRQATGVKSPGQFEVRHIPILVSEIERILKTAIRLNKFQHNLERDVVRAVLRKGQSSRCLVGKTGKRASAAG